MDKPSAFKSSSLPTPYFSDCPVRCHKVVATLHCLLTRARLIAPRLAG